MRILTDMRIPTLEEIALSQDILEPEIGRQYDPAFAETYWWGEPGNQPVPFSQESVAASKRGRGLLSALVSHNEGMRHLGDPKEIQSDQVIAEDFESGTVLRLVVERIFRQTGRRTKTKSALYTAIQDESSFTIFRYQLGSMAMYNLMVVWKVAADTTNSGRAFFPLEIDADASYCAGLRDEGYSAAIKINDIRQKDGVRRVLLGRTETERRKQTEFSQRNRSAAIFYPYYYEEYNPSDVIFKNHL